MKLHTIVTALLAALTFIAGAVAEQSKAGSGTITGYAIKDYTVTGSTEQQLEANVVKPIASALASAKSGERLTINVVGYADQTGKSDLNQDLGEQRATQVRELLLAKFPDAQITATTKGDKAKGDEANVRMVKVSWEIIPAKTVPDGPKFTPWRTIISFTIVLLLGMMGVAFSRSSQKKIPPPATVVFVEAPAPAVKEPDVLEVKDAHDGITYTMTLHKRPHGWELPFRGKADPTTFVSSERRKSAISTAKLLLVNKLGTPELDELIHAGNITATKEVLDDHGSPTAQTSGR